MANQKRHETRPDVEQRLERGSVERGRERVDASAGGGLNRAAIEAAGLDRAGEDLPGTDDVGAAARRDAGAGLGRTRGARVPKPRGEITGSGGTRGSGAGTGHVEDTAR